VTFSWRPPALTIAYTILAPVQFTLMKPRWASFEQRLRVRISHP
jgi:hypothetical protein